MKKIISIILFLLVSMIGNAQHIFYKGAVNDVHDVLVKLAYEGSFCDGTVEYLRSTQVNKLTGFVKGDSIILNEYNDNGVSVGLLSGLIKKRADGKQVLTLNWYNKAQTIGTSWLLTEDFSLDRSLTFCGKNKWTKQFEGTMKGDRFLLLLSCIESNSLKGVVYFGETNQSFLVTGYIEENLIDFKVGFSGESGEILGRMTGKLTGNKAICSITDSDGLQLELQLQLLNKLDVGGIEFLDFTTAINILYPTMNGNEGFNKMINELVISRSKYYNSFINERTVSLDKNSPDNRLIYRVYSWFEIDYLDDRFVSGFLSFQTTWTGEVSTIPFTFDLKNNYSIRESDIFYIENTRYKEQLKKILLTKVQEFPYASMEGFAEYMENKPFLYFTLRPEGIRYHTAFESLYGSQKVTVPFDRLQLFSRGKNPLVPLAYE